MNCPVDGDEVSDTIIKHCIARVERERKELMKRVEQLDAHKKAIRSKCPHNHIITAYTPSILSGFNIGYTECLCMVCGASWNRSGEIPEYEERAKQILSGEPKTGEFLDTIALKVRREEHKNSEHLGNF